MSCDIKIVRRKGLACCAIYPTVWELLDWCW